MTIPGCPNSTTWNWVRTSDATAEYNCLAHAVFDAHHWIWPSEDGCWPVGLPREETLEGVCAFLALLGYNEDTDTSREAGYSKIAIFVNDGLPVHFARQQPNGKWSSKTGSGIDLEHSSLSVVEGGEYGYVAKILRGKWNGIPTLPEMHPKPPLIVRPDGSPFKQ